MQPDNIVEESLGNRDGGVGMSKRDEVGVLGEAIDHRQDDRLAADLGKPLDEVHRDIRPHLGRHGEGLQQADRLHCLRLVSLAHRARTHEILDEAAVAWDEEIRPQVMESSALLHDWLSGPGGAPGAEGRRAQV